MKKLNPRGAQVLKAIHIFSITLWIGGLITWLPLVYGLSLNNVDATHATYLHMKAIALNVIGWGGIGSFVTGVLNGLLTNWGLFRHRWIVVKFVTVIAMILVGMFYTEQKMLANLALLEKGDAAVLSDAVFLHNHEQIKWVVPAQLVVFFLIVLISVMKPWMKKIK